MPARNRPLRSLLAALALIVPVVAHGAGGPAGAAPVADDLFPTPELFVDQAYRDVLSRPPDEAGLRNWSDQLRAGSSPTEVLTNLMESSEFAGATAPVVRLYRSVFDRLPDRDGLRFWVARRNGGMSMEHMAASFLASAEFDELNAAATTDEVVAAIYGRSLGRTPDAGGLAFWRGELDAGRVTLGGFVALVSESPEHIALRNSEVTVTLVYLGLLQRLPEPGGLEFWSDRVASGLGIDGFVASVIAGPEYRGRFAPSPILSVETVATGLAIPWDIESLPDGSLLVTERGGGIRLIDDGATTAVAVTHGDLYVASETGLMGLAVDPAFADNRRFYTCQGHTAPREIQVIAWTLAADRLSATRVADPLVAGLSMAGGRHGGCQLEFDDAGWLFVGTGDAAIGSTPQDLTALGGKVLRVDPATGGPAPGNPFEGSSNPATRLIFTLGHRNVQGLSERPGTTDMWSIEHGPRVDDEVTVLVPGGNGGWNPVPGYNENVPMTDPSFADVMMPAWATGGSTLALSGGEWFDHPAWGSWDGALAVAALKNQSLRLLFFDDDNNYRGQHTIIDGGHGRLRAVHQADDGSVYVSTSTGTNDRILRLSPS